MGAKGLGSREKLRVSGFRVSGLGFRVSGLGFRAILGTYGVHGKENGNFRDSRVILYFRFYSVLLGLEV